MIEILADIQKQKNGKLQLAFDPKSFELKDTLEVWINDSLIHTLDVDVSQQRLYNLDVPPPTDENYWLQIILEGVTICEHLEMKFEALSFHWSEIYQGKIERVDQGVVKGWLRFKDKRRNSLPFTIKVLPGGFSVEGIAGIHRDDLVKKGFEFGNVGFEVDLSAILCDSEMHHISLLVDGELIGQHKNYVCTTNVKAGITSISDNRIEGWALNTLDESNHLKIELKDKEGLLKLAIADSAINDSITSERYSMKNHSFSIDYEGLDPEQHTLFIADELQIDLKKT